MHFLVGRLELLVRRLLLLDHRLEVFPGRGELLPEPEHLGRCRFTPGNPARSRSRGRTGAGSRRGGVVEQDQVARLAHRRGLDRDDLDPDLPGSAVAAERDIVLPDRPPLPSGPQQGGPHRREESLPKHFDQTRARAPRGGGQVGRGISAIVDDLKAGIHQDAGRRVTGQQKPFGFPFRIQGGPGPGDPFRHLPGLRDRGIGPADQAFQFRGYRFALVELVPRLHRLEQIAKGSDRLRLTEPEESPWAQSVVQDGDQPLLEHRVEVDQQVPAGDQIEMGEGRIGDRVVPREDHHVPDCLADPVPAVRFHEESPQPCGGDILLDRLGVKPRPGFVDAGMTQVTRKDLHRDRAALVGGEFGERNRDRIGLLPGGTPQYPDPDREVAGTIPDQLRKDLLLEQLEALRIAKETRDIDQNILEQCFGFEGISGQESVVVVKPWDPIEHHPAGQPAEDRAPLVVAEIHPGPAADGFEDAREPVLDPRGPVPAVRADHRVLADLGDSLGDFLRRQDEVHAPSGDGAVGHALLLRGVVLGEGDPALRLDFFAAGGPITGGPRENDPDGPVALLDGQAAEELINRTEPPVRLAPGEEAQASVAEFDPRARRNHVHVVGRDRHVVFHGADRHGGGAGEDLREHAGPARGKMVHHDEGHPGIGRERLQQVRSGLHPACRRAHADDRKRKNRVSLNLRFGRRGASRGSRRATGRGGLSGAFSPLRSHAGPGYPEEKERGSLGYGPLFCNAREIIDTPPIQAQAAVERSQPLPRLDPGGTQRLVPEAEGA